MINLDKSPKLEDEQREVTLEWLKGNFDSEEILDELGIKVSYVTGDNIMAHCPFVENHKHGDANPSFGYNTEKMCFNCWVCGSGRLLDLIKKQLNIEDNKEAEKWLADRSSLWKKPVGEMFRPKKEAVSLPDFPIRTLDKWKLLHPYIYSRGITKEVAIKFNLGYDLEHDAIVIPHFFRGKLVGWQRRHLSDCNLCKGNPKYKSSPAFPKKDTLYNYDKLVESGFNNRAIVVESPLSVLKLESMGIFGAVATFGSWSKSQMKLLTGCSEVYLWPDNDKAGENNLRNVVGFLAKQMPVWIVPMVEGEGGDPGDLDLQEVRHYLSEIYAPLRLFSEGVRMIKYGDKEKIEPLSEEEHVNVEEFKQKVGKDLSSLDDKERELLHKTLDAS